MARTATTVFPEPTSPWSSRFIGYAHDRSRAITSPTNRCPSVSVNGRRLSNSAAMPSGTGGRGMAGIAAAASRRWASAACKANASSHFSRVRAGPRSALSCGRWMARIAISRGHRPCRCRTSSGSGSSVASRVSSTTWTALEICQELSLALAG